MVPLPSLLPAVQLDTVERQQQRIFHRTTLIDSVLAAEQRTGGGLTLGDALAELVRDISEAARTIGSLLQPSKPGALH